MKTTFIGINEIHTLQFTYCDTVDRNLLYVGVNSQSNTRKTPQDLMLLFTKEQVIEMYEAMLRMEKSNAEYLKK